MNNINRNQEIRQSDLITSHFTKPHPHSPKEVTPTLPLSKRISSKFIHYMDKWSDRISQKTFNRTITGLFITVMLSLFLIVGYLEGQELQHMMDK